MRNTVGETTNETLRTELEHARTMTAQALSDLATSRVLMKRLIEQHDDVIAAKNTRMVELYAANRELQRIADEQAEALRVAHEQIERWRRA